MTGINKYGKMKRPSVAKVLLEIFVSFKVTAFARNLRAKTSKRPVSQGLWSLACLGMLGVRACLAHRT